MSIDTLVFWAFVLAWLAVLALLALVTVPRAVREGLRIAKRVSALVNESPLSAQIAKAERDVLRMHAALGRLPALQRRAQDAVALVRATPLVPEPLVAALVRARREIRALRNVRH